MWRRPGQSGSADVQHSGGSAQALDQIANWVRFADTKATILVAGLGVALTMLVSNASTVVRSIGEAGVPGYIVGTLASATLIAFVWTLFWLLSAIDPRRKVSYSQPNRFAWPSLVQVSPQELAEHLVQTDVATDAWRQVLDLSELASRKFGACERALYGFAFLIVLGATCIGAAIVFTA